MYNSNTFTFIFLFHIFGLYRSASKNGFVGLVASTFSGANDAKLNVKGEVTFNSNRNGILVDVRVSDTNLEINLESDSTLNSCQNDGSDIFAFVTTSGSATFSGDGYFCDEDKVVFAVAGDITPPVCQACPSSPSSSQDRP